MSSDTAEYSSDRAEYLNEIPVSRKTGPSTSANPYTETARAVKAIKVDIISFPEEPERMEIVFVLQSPNPYAAFAYANQPELMTLGATLCRRDGLVNVGLSDRGVPIPCQRDGTPITDPLLQGGLEIEPEPNAVYYYSVKYGYLGED
jgi:hypothetical protein